MERYAELGLTDLLLQFAMPTLEPAVIAESQARFMAEVATPARRCRSDMAHSTTELTDAVDAELGLELYERMALIRRFEDAVQSLFQKGEVHGTTHLYSGQEAGAVGVCSVLGESDRVAGTYRGHGHALALGVDPEALMAELLGPRDRRVRRAGGLDERHRPGPRADRLLRHRRRLDRRRHRRGARLPAPGRSTTSRSPSSARARPTRPTSPSA